MHFHVLAVPNTQTTAAYHLDGFCHRTRLFVALLKRLGHHVTLYGVEEHDTPCDDFVRCLTTAEQRGFLGDTPYQSVPFDAGTPLFITFNTRAAGHLRAIKQPQDVIATIAGSAQMAVAEAHPELRFLEYSIGYRGVCAPYRVYQSHAWRHVVHGYTGVDGGRLFDAVIPPWWDASEFPVTAYPDSYVAFVGRLVHGKGIVTACNAAKHAGVPLKVMGFGDPALVTYGEYVGPGTPAERNLLLSRASAVLMPTQYLEPFGNVAAEAQLCGTPVIATDFGAFVESIEPGVSGFRCASLGEFVQAIGLASDLDRSVIRARAQRLYGLEAADTAYRAYFSRLEHVRSDGWRSLEPTLQVGRAYVASA